jgi:uncharacterized membrane protein YeaQ/YmgE (transglycosylase-associated protein family)
LLILAIIGFGALCGWLASMLLGRGTRFDGRALVAGLLGSFVGGLIFSLFAGDGLNLRPSGLIGSIVGAVIILAVWGAVDGRSPARR